ncbi:SMUG1 [Mytilus edulis]|uniref:SMUG1 n=1 Tax=Mytilus edulis TaxID=6550 RepID=A0A8S3RPM5_MYTED|nr:SMUG1 [Mytilus edulis]
MDQGGSNSSLPSFQSFFCGKNSSIPNMQQQQPNNNFYYDTAQSSTALDLTCTNSKPVSIYNPCTVGQNENSDKQSLYYKECLPSFANFMNYPQHSNNYEERSNHLEAKEINQARQHAQEVRQHAQEAHQHALEAHQHAQDKSNASAGLTGAENYYSYKLNEMSQMWKDHIKTEKQLPSDHEPVYHNNHQSAVSHPGHAAYPQYDPYAFMNNMPPASSQVNFQQYYNQPGHSYQNYGMYPNIKSEELYGKTFQDPHLPINNDDNGFEDLDSLILKRRKPSSNSKRAKKMRGGIEDCNYELCNMWDEVAEPNDTVAKGINVSETSRSSLSTDSNSQTELRNAKSHDSSSNDQASSNTAKEPNADILKPATIFNYVADESYNLKCCQFLEAEKRLCQHLKMISFGEPVSHIYNPLVYAFETHLKFLKTFCTSDKSVLFLAMNPGPFGMSQNGVPFGEVSAVRDWFKIRGNVQKPAREHPKRCITGLDCHRSEVSGGRFWGFFKRVCGTPEVFFRHCFVHNFCPLAFMSPTGRNITPPELRADQRNALNHACDMALIETLNILQVKIIVCIGKFVESRVQSVLKNQGNNEIRVERITHPSPINPAANKGWDDTVYQQLKDIGIMSYFTRND